MADKISFRSYCWVIGTTSYRTDNFNMNIELQLTLLKEFRGLLQNKNKLWSKNGAFQAEYYNYLKSRNFMKGNAKRPDKDAREKTSGLRDIGLLDDERNLTAVGEELVKIAQSEDFSADNLFEIPKDSFLYLKQLLKTSNELNGKYVRPFVVFLYVISKTKYLTYDEFTYLLPLCIDKETTKKVVDNILLSPDRNVNYDYSIVSVFMNMENYRQALQLLQKNDVTEALLCTVGMNRKSAGYDKLYYELYQNLYKIVFDKENLALELYETIKKFRNSKVGSAWRKYFFRSNKRTEIEKEGLSALHPVGILLASDENSFKEKFFILMHLFKMKANLSDYFDLNRRYFKITDIVLFENDEVKLDALPKRWIEDKSDELLAFAFEKTDLLTQNVSLEEIHPCLKIDAESLYQSLGKELGIVITDKKSVHQVIWNKRYERFEKLVDEKFDKDTLITLFEYFEDRKDDKIRSLVTDNADIPTIFEYVLGIAWYIISNRKGDVLSYMNLSLDADLLPKTHAGGKKADIVWKYEKTKEYPKHTLLIEATLADGINQRRMEMEPVSRHLGEYRLMNQAEEAYCIFVTTFLHLNVISDFRARRFMEYYNKTGTEMITGMKIFPIQTSELKEMLKRDMKYSKIYKMLDSAYGSGEAPKEWYENHIVNGMDL